MPESRFPLLQLPRVVLLECIENLDVFEIILFSLLSKRAKSIAKLIRLNLLDIHITCEGDPQIWFKVPNVPWLDWVIDYNKEKDSSAYPAFHSILEGPKAVHFLIFHDNGSVIENMKQMVEHICEVFRSLISEIVIFEESLINWIIQFQPTIRHVRIRKGVVSSIETMDRILKNIKVTEFFRLEPLTINEKFQTTKSIPSRSVFVFDCSWLTLPSILNGTNSIIRLYDSKLTPSDINTILKEWQKGSKLQNLEYLEVVIFPLIDLDSFSDDVLKDLDLTDVVENDGRPMTVKIDDEWTYTLPEVQTVKKFIRNDGMIGSIFETSEVFDEEEMQLCFYFQVWSRQT